MLCPLLTRPIERCRAPTSASSTNVGICRRKSSPKRPCCKSPIPGHTVWSISSPYRFHRQMLFALMLQCTQVFLINAGRSVRLPVDEDDNAEETNPDDDGGSAGRRQSELHHRGAARTGPAPGLPAH